jgi:hypothetical protein
MLICRQSPDGGGAPRSSAGLRLLALVDGGAFPPGLIRQPVIGEPTRCWLTVTRRVGLFALARPVILLLE